MPRWLTALAVLLAAVLVSTPASATEPPVVVFVGDSYTQAAGDPNRWPTVLSAANGWTEVNLAAGGTGYVTPYDGPLAGFSCGAPYCPPFVDMVPAIAAEDPDIVIVSGGRNDLGAETTPQYHTAVGAFFQALRTALPGVAVYATSPLWDDDPVPAGIFTMRGRVFVAVSGAGGCYVDLADPLLGHPELVYDGVHPNAAGHTAIAAEFQAMAPPAANCSGRTGGGGPRG